MKRSQFLNVVHTVAVRAISHYCPYKGHQQWLETCYLRAQDIEEEFCYACPHVEKLKAEHGLRTYRRAVVRPVCKWCGEGSTAHAADAPHKSALLRCQGFEPEPDQRWFLVATKADCTSWMAINVDTGERLTLSDFKKRRDPNSDYLRFRLPLVGAPGTVPSDSRDAQREKAAAAAEKQRRSRHISKVSK